MAESAALEPTVRGSAPGSATPCGSVTLPLPTRAAALVLPTHQLDFLVRDRFDEFAEQASKTHAPSGRTFGRSGTRDFLKAPELLKASILGATDNVAAQPAVQTGAFMRQFFDAVGEVQGFISKGKADVKLMSGAVQDALGATSQAQEQEASGNIDTLAQQVTESITAAKKGLEVLKARTDEEAKQGTNSQVVKIRNNMQQAMAKKQQQLLLDFQKVQQEYRDNLQRRQSRELAILMPEVPEEEREEMIRNGETSSMVLVQKMAGAHATLLDEVNRIREKHQDIVRLEQSIADLAQVFQEMAVLVDAQGEILDSIEVNVSQVKDATFKAEKNLKDAKKAQSKHRKYICCLMIIMTIAALSILAPVIAKAGE